MDLKSGGRLGVFEIVGPIGRGGMGAVYRAIDTRLNRPVAIKVVDEQFADRFRSEARAISSLNHPNVCILHDVGPDYLVMELIEGVTLADHLKSGRLPVVRAVEYGAQIARALAAAHGKGVVHRDLKPANIMITKSGVKVLDFGVAQVAAAPGETATMSRAIVGTPAYMAPEQLHGSAGDARTDIFAMGLILAEMITGARPPVGGVKFPPDVPPPLASVVERCLAADPDDRWQSAADAGWALAASGAPTPATQPRANRERWLWAAAVMLLAGAVGAMFVTRPAPLKMLTVHFEVPPPPNARFLNELGVVTPVISPDGRTLAFAATVDGRAQIWIRPLDSDSSRVLAGTEGVIRPPFWSPDSRSLAFLAESQLKRINIAGGPPQTIAAIGGSPASASWSSQGVIVYGFGSAERGGLFRVSADGGPITEIRLPDRSMDEDGLLFPEFLPDGNRFFFLAGVKNQKGNRIYLGAIDSSENRFLAQINSRTASAGPGHAMFIRERTLLTQRIDDRAGRLLGDPAPIADHVDYFSPIGLAGFTVSTNGVLAYHATENSSQLVWVNRSGIETGRVGPIANYDYIRLSPEGTRLALDIRDSRTNAEDVHVLDLTRGAADTRITSAIGGEFAPIWSPDGKRLVFSWDRDAPPYLHQVALNDLGAIAPISRPSFPQIPGDWHPSGSHVAFEEQTRETGSNVVVLDISGAGKATPFVNTRFNETSPRFSPDGRWMAYVSDEAGTPDVYVRPFPGPGEAHRISSGGGANPRWRRDGRELFFVAGQQVMAVAVSAAQRFAAGTPIARFDRKPARIIDYDVARDGQSFLINSEITGPETKPITVVVNWPAMLATR